VRQIVVPNQDPRSERPAPLEAPRLSATMDRAAALVEALGARALRHERVLEVLDLKAARRVREMARVLQLAAARWARAADAAARTDAAGELLELLDQAEAFLVEEEVPASRPTAVATEPPPARQVTEVCPVGDRRAGEGGESFDAALDVEPSPESDQSAWQGLLGAPRANGC